MKMKPYNWLAYDQEPKPLDFVLPGLLSGSVGALVAPGGQGKSWLILQVLAQVATGKDLLGLGDFEIGRSAYLPAEDPTLILDHRTHHLKSLFTPDEYIRLSERMLIYPLFGRGPDIEDRNWFADIKEAAEGTRLMVLDTFSRFHRCDENSQREMANVILRLEKIARETGCTLIFLHHTQKAAALNGDVNKQQASRGASTLTDNIRWQAYLVGMSSDEAREFAIPEDSRGHFVKFGLSKVNYGAPMSVRWFLKGKGGLLEPVDEPAPHMVGFDFVPSASVSRKQGRVRHLSDALGPAHTHDPRLRGMS